jgi:hypothetical protein
VLDSARSAAPIRPIVRPGFPIIAPSGPILAPAVADGGWRVEDLIRTDAVELEPVAQGAEPVAEAEEAAPSPAAASIQVEAEQPEAEAVPAFEAPSEEAPAESAAPVAVMEQPFDAAALPGPVGESEHQPTGDELLVAAEAADLAGDEKALRSLLVWTSRAYAREGKFEAGLDATHRLLQRGPDDVDAHLVLVELYVARSWNGLAAEKLALLGRLADLDGDDETRQRLCAVASRAFPNDERLESLCS